VSTLLPIADMLGKLVPRLATTHDGERLATVAAIDRTLRSAGLDWHHLAKAVAAEPPPARVVFVERPSREPETWEQIARWCRDHDDGRLKEHERKFAADMAARLIHGGQPTERQGAWLRALYAKLRAHG
jgi:hypothetical protein